MTFKPNFPFRLFCPMENLRLSVFSWMLGAKQSLWPTPMFLETKSPKNMNPPKRRRLLKANNETPLPGGNEQIDIKIQFMGVVDGSISLPRVAQYGVSPYLVPKLPPDDESGMTSEEESMNERVPNHLALVRTVTYQATDKRLLAPVTLDPTPEDLEAQECVRSRIAKIEKELLGGTATTVKRYRKTNGAKRLLAACRVGSVVTTREPIGSPEVELMRKRILADYERDLFSGEVRLRPGQEHPEVCGTERLGFAKLDLYPNAKPKSVKPIRLVGERAAEEQEIGEDLLARGWIELCPASKWASNSFVVPKKEKGKWRLVVDYGQLN